ncbi:nucleotidyltransferase domain-containing protein [Chromatiaceae bacterium AAb-1]|nr:nucleotidyltransferase domain-containing protein [Chromatiaceae bacterium AAb-1]
MKKPTGLQLTEQEWHIVSAIIQQLLADYDVWAFGSRVKGTAKPFSDLDLAVITSTPLPISRQAEISEAFTESALPWKVDVVDWATTPEAFRNIIMQHSIVLHNTDNPPKKQA